MTGPTPGGDAAGTPRAPRQRDQDPGAMMPEPDDAVTEAITLPLSSSQPLSSPVGREAAGTAGRPSAPSDPPPPSGVAPDAEPLSPAAAAAEEPPTAPEPEDPPGQRRAGTEMVPVGSGGPAGPGGPSPAHRRPRTASRRQWWMKAAAVALCALLGLSLAAQLRRNERDGELAGARQEDLVRILDELENREQRLQGEINELQERRRTLSSAAEGSQTVQEDLEQRAEELGILAGTIPAEGDGLRLVFFAGTRRLSADVILDAVEELRGAGAEALQIGGSRGDPVRIVASTAFLDADDGDLLVDGRRLSGPYTLLAIGEPQTMRAALAIPGGVVDSVEGAGGKLQIDAPETVTVSATLSPARPRYAEPVD
ncbi:DUF881 domain-containing protein [Cryptosporangium minutisporangium]|uniref:DUF881 domain-containing protein n=1 Tax=Cryptosporangium minutisporangium TaxID=113569 RepID=UPI0035E8D977